MGATTTRSLYLSVDGNVSGLTSAAKAGKSVLLSLGDAAVDVQEEVKKAFADMGASAPAQAKQIEQSYAQTFAAIRQNAQAVLAAPTKGAALQVINTGAAREAAAAAEAQAVALRQVATAAATVADRAGAAGAAERVLAVAAASVAERAEQEAIALRNQANVLGTVEAEIRATAGGVEEASEVVVSAHGRMSASGAIMQHVIRSSTDSFAAGLPIATIFAEQIGRISEAAVLAGQSAETEGTAFAKFGAIMSGPVGIGISLGISLLSILIPKLLEGGDAADAEAEKLKRASAEMDAAVSAADSFGSAQSQLGRIIDLTTGALKTQNQVLIETIRLQAQQRLNDARQAEKDDAKKLTEAAEPGVFSGRSYGTRGVNANTVSNEAVGAIFQRFLKGEPLQDAQAALRHLTPTQLAGQDPLKLQGLLLKVGTDRNDQKAQQQVLDVINGKPIPADLKPYERPKAERETKPKVDHTAERAANADREYQNQNRQVDDALAKARLKLTDSAEAEYKIEVDQIAADLARKNRALQDEVTAKKLTQAQADILKGKNAQLASVDEQVAAEKLRVAIAKADYDDAREERAGRVALLQIGASLALTRREQLAYEQRALKEQQAQRRDDLGLTIATTTDPRVKARAQQQLAGLPDQEKAEDASLQNQHLDPLESYKRQLKSNVGDMKDSLKSVEVDGLKSIEDGFVGIINGTETVASAFKTMASSIIADLVRIAAEKAILSVLGFSTGGPVGSVMPEKHAGGGFITGKGSGTSDDILSWLSNGEFVMNAAATRKHLPLLKAMNDNQLPGFATGGLVGSLPSIPTSYPALPRAEQLRSSNDNRPLHFDLRGAVMTAELIDQMQQLAAASGGQAYVESVKHTNRSIAGLTRRTL